MITSAVVSKNGNPYLVVNGEKIGSLAYLTYIPEKGGFDNFARAGYRLYSTCVFFGTNKLNEFSGLDVPCKGIFDAEMPDFSRFDNDIRQILTTCPDALIFPRVNVSLSEKWEQEHPDELCYEGCSLHPERKRACMASDVWAQEVKRQLTLFIGHVESSYFRDHIIGYQVAGGNTEEWFAYNTKGGIGKATEEKFARLVEQGRDDTEESYYHYLSQVTASRVCEFASHIKELTQRRLVVGSFYGYTLEMQRRGGTHHALGDMLRCPDIDFICSPFSYAQTRAAGRDHAYMLPVHSLKLHGKLYFTENDTRTHLSVPINDNPHYNRPLWFGPDREGSLEILKMHFSKGFVYGHAAWWFDLWGGWYDDPAYMAFMEKVRNISLEQSVADSVVQVAVLCDELAPAALEDSDKGLKEVFYDSREALGKTGVPYHIYLTSDFDEIKDRYQAFVLLEPRSTKDSEMIKASGVQVLTVTPENSQISSAELRKFYKNSGVHLYSREDMVVYANEGYLFIHTVNDGKQHISVPEDPQLWDMFADSIFAADFESPAGKSYLLKKL